MIFAASSFGQKKKRTPEQEAAREVQRATDDATFEHINAASGE